MPKMTQLLFFFLDINKNIYLWTLFVEQGMLISKKIKLNREREQYTPIEEFEPNHSEFAKYRTWRYQILEYRKGGFGRELELAPLVLHM